MSLKTVQFSPGTCLRCGGVDGVEIAAGDSVKIYLDTERNPDFPEFISGIVTARAQASETDSTRTYTFQYNTEDLDDAAAYLNPCDVLSLICVSCCDLLQDELNELGRFRTLEVTLLTSAAFINVVLNADEFIVSVLNTTANSGVLLDSVTQSGTTATITFSNTPLVDSTLLLLVKQPS